VPLLVVVGTADTDVPPDLVVEFHAQAVRVANTYNTEGSEAEDRYASALPIPKLLVISDADHFEPLSPTTPAWAKTLQAVEDLIH
jgi:pimeloyl-ACP methyl ester carboxylesterase